MGRHLPGNTKGNAAPTGLLLFGRGPYSTNIPRLRRREQRASSRKFPGCSGDAGVGDATDSDAISPGKAAHRDRPKQPTLAEAPPPGSVHNHGRTALSRLRGAAGDSP